VRFYVRRRFVDLMASAAASVAQQVICEESISARYDGLLDQDYVAVLVSMDVVHRSHDWAINERRSPHRTALHCPSSLHSTVLSLLCLSFFA